MYLALDKVFGEFLVIGTWMFCGYSLSPYLSVLDFLKSLFHEIDFLT